MTEPIDLPPGSDAYPDEPVQLPFVGISNHDRGFYVGLSETPNLNNTRFDGSTGTPADRIAGRKSPSPPGQ